MAKLTLRDLFAVVTIVALALGWWLDHRRLMPANRGYLWTRASLAVMEQRLAEAEKELEECRRALAEATGV